MAGMKKTNDHAGPTKVECSKRKVYICQHCQDIELLFETHDTVNTFIPLKLGTFKSSLHKLATTYLRMNVFNVHITIFLISGVALPS